VKDIEAFVSCDVRHADTQYEKVNMSNDLRAFPAPAENSFAMIRLRNKQRNEIKLSAV
jgi:hypothetical protein